jgi:YgiT-type zinc finger domain-containing protein
MIQWIQGRINEKAYFNSEHMVRYLTQGLFTLPELEQVIVNGKILEIHSHSLRPDGYLILGHSGDRPVHVMCARDTGDNLILLYAYRPSLPTWKDERTRMTTQEPAIPENLSKCFFCNSLIKPITVGNFDFRWEGDLYVIKKVPAGLCVQCGEKYISALASKKIVHKIENQAFSGTESVRVFDYDG